MRINSELKQELAYLAGYFFIGCVFAIAIVSGVVFVRTLAP